MITDIIRNNSIKFLSGLANNNNSIVPMATKDTISNCAIVHTYKKEGGKDDARERAIEEFGTGAVWLFGIPTCKKIIDKTVYPALHLDSEFDVRVLKNKDILEQNKKILFSSSDEVLKSQKNIFKNLEKNNDILKKFTNAQLYKGLSIGKFATSTAISAFALSKIIDYKQKTTQRRIEEDFYRNNASKILIDKNTKSNLNFSSLAAQKNKKEDISFKGISAIGQAFMYNPIVNNIMLDGVITSKRLSKARHGEKKEVGLKEAFQLFFIYALAKPLQAGFEFIGNKTGLNIGLDPKVLFDKDINKKLPEAKKALDSILSDEKLYTNAAGVNKKLKIKDKFVDEKVLNEKLFKLNPSNPLIDILDKNGAINALRSKDGNVKSISFIKPIDSQGVLKSFGDITDLSATTKKLSHVKAFKVFSVIGNVGIAAWAMGVLQPKINIAMRKILNNGDNRNPAIVAQEKELHKNLN